MAVAVVITKSAQKDIDGFSADLQVRIRAKIVELRDYPQVVGIKALKGGMKGLLRARVGSYRIVFSFSAGILTIQSVDDRKETY